VDFEPSAKATELSGRLEHFLAEHILPAEPVYEAQRMAAGDPHAIPAVLLELQERARELGLWNLFLPHPTRWSTPLSTLDYAPLAELTGHSFIAPEVLNCSPPDAGNMELLSLFGTPEQQERWLRPLLGAEIRSCFAMTEPDVASSDATNISLRIEHDGGDYVLNGRKWWITGAADPRCTVALVVGRTRTDPAADRHRQHSIVLVPMDSPGLTVVRNLPTFGFVDREGHCELEFADVRVPASNLLGEEGAGFAIAQARLGPGRVHHSMRSIGAAERALELMCRRVAARTAWGKPLSEQGVIREWIARARIEIEQARLLTLKTAWLIDTRGSAAARTEIAAIKVAAQQAALHVVDRAIQAFGGAGVGPDVPLAAMYSQLRWLQIGDGPDEVHLRSIARTELARYAGNGGT
jgi:acyl-CoA dehydrogenase